MAENSPSKLYLARLDALSQAYGWRGYDMAKLEGPE